MSNDLEGPILRLLAKFRKERSHSCTLVEGLCNSLNKLSYLSNTNVNSSLGETISPHRLRLIAEAEVYELKIKLENSRSTIKNSLNDLIRRIGELEHAAESTLTIELSFLKSTQDEILQQNMLEEHAIERLLSFTENPSQDQDALVTIIACFKYSPYCRQATIDALIDALTKSK